MWRFNTSRKMCSSLLNRSLHTTGQNFAEILDGKKIADEIKNEIKTEINALVANGERRPQLTVLLVGDDPASATYVKNKFAAAKYVGIDSELLKFDASTSESKLVNTIKELNLNGNVDAILVQLPLPPHINESVICLAVDPSKDVDGFHFINAGKMFLDMEDALMACTPLGVLELLKRYKIETFGKMAVVCGRSKNVGLPIAVMLQADGKKTQWGMDATVSICNRNSHPLALASLTMTADILITATGIPGLIHSEIVKPGACVIDVGISRIQTPDGATKLVGDVDFEGVKQVAGQITPVPGGVGPMTIAMLMRNTLFAAQLKSKKN